ncbi:hypothetical protein [Nocardia sp. NBC_00511]|uniref:hypothetical protein n=1 Tax=Nocardia sp. NBC_00511 TaxID=2903591 RepID=UPI002F913536
MTTSTAEEIFAEVTQMVGDGLDPVLWAEDEIAAAQHRHPHRADEIWHSYPLLKPFHERMSNELVYRAYCRELLERVATGRDTRPATAIEVVLTLRDVSLAAPLNTAAAGLYFRMWKAAGMPEIDPEGHTADLTHYEALEGSRIDEYEAETRRRARREDRTPAKHITCCGLHNGRSVECRYTATEPAPAEHCAPPEFTSAPAPEGPAEQLALI